MAVIAAIILGIALGVIAPATAAQLEPLGSGFIKLIKMTIAPLIFCTLVAGIAGMKSMKAVGKAGGLALVYFEVMSTVALVIGLVVVNLVKPGVGMNIDTTKIDASAIAKYTGAPAPALAPKPAAPAPPPAPGGNPVPALVVPGATPVASSPPATAPGVVTPAAPVMAPGPAKEVSRPPSALPPTAPAPAPSAAHKLTLSGFILEIIPDTFVGAFTHGELLPVLLLALLFGFALHNLGDRGKPILELVERTGSVVFGIVGIIMYVAPIGAFGAMASTVGSHGIGALRSLGELMGCFYATCLVFVFGVLGIVARLSGFSIFRFVKFIRDELFLVLGTSSSESALPRMMAKLEVLGASRPVVGLVIPAGYSFNLDGTSIYLTMAAVFVAQATNTPLDLWHQLELLGILLLTSKGAAGVTGSGFIVLAATLGTLGNVPVAGLAVILGIDRFMSEARALTNVIGNGVATLVVARWCGELDDERLRQNLAAPPG